MINLFEKEDIVLILYIFGIIGKFKGVMLIFDNILVNVDLFDVYKMYEEIDVIIVLLLLYYILFFLGIGVMFLLYFVIIVFFEDIFFVVFIDVMKKYKVIMMIGVFKFWEVMYKKIMDIINLKVIIRFIFKFVKKVNFLSFSKLIFKKVSEGFGGYIKFFVLGGFKLNL